MSLRPRLASQAPKVSKIMLIVETGILVSVRERGIMATNVNIIPSRENSAMRRWLR